MNKPEHAESTGTGEDFRFESAPVDTDASTPIEVQIRLAGERPTRNPEKKEEEP